MEGVKIIKTRKNTNEIQTDKMGKNEAWSQPEYDPAVGRSAIGSDGRLQRKQRRSKIAEAGRERERGGDRLQYKLKEGCVLEVDPNAIKRSCFHGAFTAAVAILTISSLQSNQGIVIHLEQIDFFLDFLFCISVDTIRQRSRGKSKCYGSASVGCCEVRRRQASVFTQGRPVAGAAGE
ncbi:hypothetical protein SAY86_029542 [Trapa natans]|uniref:Uncharacterized protein n=1 Tax=Trapa natans TaxID=22666 RepID=A0AAN7M1E4_TRANT|nr:hypothetical protein SAY86_029542 [Trapa natans]